MTLRSINTQSLRPKIDSSGYRIRAIRPDDEQRVSQFLERLSPGTLYFRFGRRTHPVISEQGIADICNPNPARMAGFVAFKPVEAQDNIFGIGRIELNETERHCEFVIVVGDAWQGSGVGRELMTQLIDTARTWGVDSIYGETLPSNHSMHRFCEKLGFRRQRSSANPGLVRMQIDFFKR